MSSKEKEVLLYKRITREHDNRKYTRKPAKGNLIIKLEKLINETHLLIEFDGYIIPKNEKRVTLLLYCREYNTELVKDVEDKILAKKLFDELKKEVEFDIALKLSSLFKCSIACVFSPYDYPQNQEQSEESSIMLFPRIEQKRSYIRANTQYIKSFFMQHEKRATTKNLTFACTKLEYFLSQIPEGQKNTIAFPGDADGVLMDNNYKIIAILEYKSDTQGRKLENESIHKYKVDTTKYNVLDDFCILLNVPLVIIFWSDTHTKTKIIVRNAENKKNISFILEAKNYDELALKIKDILIDLKQFHKQLED